MKNETNKSQLPAALNKHDVGSSAFDITKWKPADWLGTLEEWRRIVCLEYVLSQGYEEAGDVEEYTKLHQKGWFGT